MAVRAYRFNKMFLAKNHSIKAAKMTPQQIAKAQRLASEWQPKPPPKPETPPGKP